MSGEILLCIDPGQSGGFAWRGPDGIVGVCKMPETTAGVVEFFQGIYLWSLTGTPAHARNENFCRASKEKKARNWKSVNGSTGLSLSAAGSSDSLKSGLETAGTENRLSVRVILENVGGYRPGNSGPAAVTFGRHCGILEGALGCFPFQVSKVVPRVWQTAFPGLPSGEGKQKALRKKFVLLAVRRAFPSVKVTLAVSDALGMLFWALAGEF